MPNEDFEMQEKIRKLVVKIVKHYRGKGPENVRVKIEDERITIYIKGVLSALSEILVKEGAVELVKDYWKVIKSHLEKEFVDEVHEILGHQFTYSWDLCNLENEDRMIIIKVNKTMV